ncbi:integrase, catalytic region, zinc finger, CCHC-type containing protein [Tanacetum coccineum]
MKLIPANDTAAARKQKEDDLTCDDLKQCETNIKAMNPILISIPNDIYNFVDACQNAKEMWDRVKRLMQGESLSFVFNYFLRLINNMQRNKVKPIDMAVNTKFLNSLQPEWYKYVTNVRISKNLADDPYDVLFDHLRHYEKIVNVCRAKRAGKTHDPLALVAYTYASSSSSRSSPNYYVTHPPSVIGYDDDYQGEAIDNLTTTMMLLARAITQRYSTPTNNRLRTSSNTRNQAVVQADRLDIQSRNVRNDGRYVRKTMDNQGDLTGNRNVQKETGNGNVYRILRTTANSGNAFNVQCYNCNAKGHYARECPKPRVRDSKYFLEQMLLVKKDEAEILLNNEHNDFLLVDAPEIKKLKDLSATVCMMARLQQADNDSEMDQTMTLNSSVSDTIFDDPDMEVNDGKVEHDTNAHDQRDSEMELLARNAYKEAEKQQKIAKDAKQRNVVLTKELEKYKEKNDNLSVEIEKVKSESKDIQENLLKRIKILYNDFQRCQAQSIDFELQLQHQQQKKNCEQSLKNLCENSWISKMDKLENENVSLEFQVQSLIKERKNVKLEYQKLFDSIKKKRCQTQKEINILIESVNQNTYAYGDVRSQNQDLFITISELKVKLKMLKKVNFCDGDLEVAFRSKTCYVRNLEGEDLLMGARKSKKAILKPKLVPSTHSKLELIHMDLYGPMRVESINGKKYILVIVDDYSRYMWVYFLRTKDEASDMIIKFITQIQLNFKVQIKKVRTDNGIKFKNATLKSHYEKLGIMHQTSIAITPQQNGVVERRNRTLVEAARTMLIFSKAPTFLCAGVISTACFTQNRSLVHNHYNKTPYELLIDKKPIVQYF